LASFPEAQASQPTAASITTHDPEPVLVAQVPDLSIAHPIVQPMPDDRILLVGARCRWRPEGPDQNAVVVDGDGVEERWGTFGDGIEDVRATPSGEVWVSYFDEGVFGNYGWGNPGPEPIGAPGLIRWTPTLQPAWRFPDQPGLGSIADCYALNVDGDDAWICPYTDFPIIHVTEGAIHRWNNAVQGARALMADHSTRTVGLIGGYGPEHDRILTGRLEDEELQPTFTGRLTDPDGRNLDGAQLIGRGSELNVIHENNWYKLDLSDLPPTNS
jgi:hypothetical protein